MRSGGHLVTKGMTRAARPRENIPMSTILLGQIIMTVGLGVMVVMVMLMVAMSWVRISHDGQCVMGFRKGGL